MEQSFNEEAVKTEPMDLDYCQNDVNESLDEPTAFVYDSQFALEPEIRNGEIEHAPENDNQVVGPSKQKRGPTKKSLAAKWTQNNKKRTTARRKSNIDKHEDNRDFIESTINSETNCYHQPTMLEEPQDLIIKTDQDNPDHPSVDLPCPPTLQHYTDDEISSAFEQCRAETGKVKLKFSDPDSLFGKVYTVLTSNKKSCLYERQYLHRLWLQKYKPESLKKFGDDQIGTAFLLCYNNKSNLNVNAPNGLFHKVSTFLTENKKSNCIERKYLFDLWTIKYKEALHNPEKARLSKLSKASRVKIHRRLLRQRERDLLLEHTIITQPVELVGEYPSPELETTFQTENDEYEEIPPSFPLIPAEEEEQIRIRVKVEVEANDGYDASNAGNNKDSSVVNVTSSKVALPVPMLLSQRHIPVPDNPEPQQEAIKDTDPKLTLKPVVRLTRLNTKKIQEEEEGSTEIRGQSENTSINKRYDDNSAEDNLSVNEGVSDDYIASEHDNDRSDDDLDFGLNTSTPAKNRGTTVSSRCSRAKTIRRGRGRPRLHPRRVRNPRLKKSVFEKLVNYWHWGVYKYHKTVQLPIPVDLWQESHRKHAEFIVSNTCEILTENVEKTAPTAGKGTFANPHWTYSDGGKEDKSGPLKCVCPACGLTFFEIDELLHHRDKSHREYLSMCVICAKPVDKRINMAPHLATHCSVDQLEEFFKEEIITFGAPPKGSFYRLYKCRKCRNIFVGSKGLYMHKGLCALKSEKRIRQKTGGNRTSIKSFSFIKKYTPSSSRSSSHTISSCKVCEKPLSSEYMSLHLRTHFNFEEQKKYVREQQSKMKNANKVIGETSILGKDTTEMRIEQLKNQLEALERKNGNVITKWTKPTLDVKAPVIQKKANVKRDGNYGPVQCATCGKVLSKVYTLRKHEIAKHEGGFEKKFKCSICHRPYKLQELVNNHTPTHFNLDEQEKYSVWRGSLWEFLERLNSGEDLNKPPISTTRMKIVEGRRRIRKKVGRPRKDHHQSKSGGGHGQPSGSGGAAAIVSTRLLEEGVGVAEGTLTSTFSSAAEVPSSTLQHWNTAYGQGQQGQDDLGY